MKKGNIISSFKSQQENKDALKDIMDKKSKLYGNSQNENQKSFNDCDLTDPISEILKNKKLNESQSNKNLSNNKGN